MPPGNPGQRGIEMKMLNVGLIGCRVMGRADSNANRKVGNFFDLEYQPVL